MKPFKQRPLPLTDQQITVCNIILKNNYHNDLRGILNKMEYDDSVFFKSCEFLLINNLLKERFPITLTDKGLRYINKGIARYFKDSRRNEFLNSPILKTILTVLSILASIISIPFISNLI